MYAARAIPQIAVFGRIPRVGAGKTRLARVVGAERAAELAEAFLRDALEHAWRLGLPMTWFCVAPEPDRRPAETLAAARALTGGRIQVTLQQGSHLGARMDSALEMLTIMGPGILVGGDVPDLPLAYLQTAVARLLHRSEGPRLVVGPAADGGFVLIGSNRAPGAMLRDETVWGSGDVCARTIRLAEAATPRWNVHRMEPWWDIDEPADLVALGQRIRGLKADVPLHTARALGLGPLDPEA
jgi:rSAM/selenodomain-associated transferase 1